MRYETLLIKNLLTEKYPDINFSVRIKHPKNYVRSSDKIIVSYSWSKHKIPVDEFISYLKDNTKNIVIGRIGFPLAKTNYFAPLVYNVKTDTWDDVDLVDFIEIEDYIE